MVKRLSKLETFFTSTIVSALVSLFDDLPYTPLCAFFFGEPEYPSDEE